MASPLRALARIGITLCVMITHWFFVLRNEYAQKIYQKKGIESMLIAVDHGNKQIKLPSGRFFTSGINESDARPPFGDDFLKYKGKYYTLSNSRIPYMRDKTGDDRFYILNLFAIGFEIEDSGRYTEDLIPVELLVGLPPAHFGMQYEQFEKYFSRGVVEEFELHGKKFTVRVDEVTAYPQAFAAAMTMFYQISTYPKAVVIDIGAFTADYLLIKNGQADLSVCGSLENGVIMLYNQIAARVNSDLDMLLEESDIDAILKGEPNGFGEDVRGIVTGAVQIFISDLIGKLRERSIDLRSCKAIFVGGGSILLRKQIEISGKAASPIFVSNISANAKGYEFLYKASKAGR